MRLWKLLGLAGLAGVAATGAVLATLAADPSATVRRVVAARQSAPAEVLCALAGDGDTQAGQLAKVRLAVGRPLPDEADVELL